MFYIYGTTGQVFRGSLEQLRQVKGVDSLTRTRRVASIGRDGGDAGALPAGGEGSTPVRGAAAVRAYVGAPTPSQRSPIVQVAQVMSRTVQTLTQDSTLVQAWQRLTQFGVGQMPVVDGAGALVGLFTRADLLRAVTPAEATGAGAPLTEAVTRWMHTPVPAVAPESDIRRVTQVLLDLGLPGLPVLGEQGAVIGFVSRSDILQAVATDPPLDLWG